VAFKVRPPPDLVRRYGEAAGVVPLRPPWFQVAGPRDTLLLVPGASRATKRWPVERYAEVGGTWGGAVLCLGGPDDEGLCAELARRVGPRAEILCERGFTRTLAALGRARVALGNDTGITHLCAAAGLPTFVLFGPTTVEDGFWADRAVPLGADLPCRPCARFGRDSCPFGDHLCMESLETSFVLSRLERFRP
jgi:ADP-heptose:LPS heptosyltransferase